MDEGKQKISGNVWVLALFVLMIAGVLTGILLGQKQDEQYKANEQLGQQAMQKFKEGNIEAAEADLRKLTELYPDSYQTHWKYGISLLMAGKYAEAEKELRKARELHPFLVQNQQFVVQYGEAMYRQGKYADAERYFVEAQKLNTNPELSNRLVPVLQDIKVRMAQKQ
jgi:Flp pilus assembly protein TadD